MQVEQVVGNAVEKNWFAEDWSIIVFEGVSDAKRTKMCSIMVRWTPVRVDRGVAWRWFRTPLLQGNGRLTKDPSPTVVETEIAHKKRRRGAASKSVDKAKEKGEDAYG